VLRVRCQVKIARELLGFLKQEQSKMEADSDKIGGGREFFCFKKDSIHKASLGPKNILGKLI